MFSPKDLESLLNDLRTEAERLLAAVGDGEGIPAISMASVLCTIERARAALARRRVAIGSGKGGK
jgi:hypothetical protein